MKKALFWIGGILGVVVLIIFLLVGYVVRIQNNFVTMDEEVKGSWAQVENQLQRRYDLIPNLVNTVKGFAAQEKSIFLGVADARSKLAGARTIDDKIAASRGMESAISRLLVISENYPQLKSDQNFIKLQDTLEGAENRLSVERKRYNDVVKVYNIELRKVPKGQLAQMLGFKPATFFQVEEAAKAAPKVTF
ncbi:MAG: LemA family protein [Candidatus Margulisiibacteriota bacterium]|nr:MAG: LemA family protein [Candidatus Margulisbacteria bacterium GWD2_39_127]OGI02496.1 MAG: LemA family protein [Candidatus Margulisbacteria bacterium GWF2_38_17]OGI10989.1 MAG: LemA family protein [Candidatus Margulisbacteria bacterium GWE2_39_32]PZM83183.1 MAG: LemA family protein [Candidatus Margulisiibacteriota bacterium]HAR62514.1 LemA family protein [Candidatus Margulisiibacteriota bacterium]